MNADLAAGLESLAAQTEPVKATEIKDEHWFPCVFLFHIKSRNLHIFELSNGERVWSDAAGQYIPTNAIAMVRMQPRSKKVGQAVFQYEALEVKVKP